MNLWPDGEKPREKLLRYSAKYLSDAELLAIFLNTGIPGKTALDIARELLVKFQGIKKLLQCPPSELYQHPGIGKAKYALLQAAVELGHRYYHSDIQVGKTLNSSQLTQSFLASQLKHSPHEIFACLFLDNHHRLIAYEELFRGTLQEASIYPREVVKSALSHNAAHLIFAHNHPSGNATPSQADKDITHLLKQALALVDIRVIDHVVIGGKVITSFAELGLL